MVLAFMNRPDLLTIAAEIWLEARRKFKAGGQNELRAFSDATDKLFVAFVEDWTGEEDLAAQTKAFHDYRAMLADQDDLQHGICCKKKPPRSVRNLV